MSLELPELPAGWRWSRLADIADIKGGLTKGQKRRPNEALVSVPYLRVANVQRGYLDLSDVSNIHATQPEIDELRLLPGDVLFNEGGDRDKLGRGWVWAGEINICIHQNHVFRARIISNCVEPRLLSYWGNSSGKSYFFNEGKQTTNLASINISKLGNLPVPIPPLSEQPRILGDLESLLSRLDAAAASLARVQAKLKAYRASVLKAAVEGRLVPTEAALAKQEQRDYEPASVLLDRILGERRRRWEEAELARLTKAGKPPKDDKWKAKYEQPAAPDPSKLPPLPEGWCWATWSQIGFSQNGRPFPSSEYRDNGVRLLRPGNLFDDGQVKWTEKNTRCLPERWADEYSGHLIGSGEIVMNLTAQSLADDFLGRVCITPVNEWCLLNQRIARLTPILCAPRYLLWMFKSSWFRGFVSSLNTGSLIQHMFTSQLEHFPIPLPPLEEQLRIGDEVERRISVAEGSAAICERSRGRATRLRQAVLKWAFEGKLVDQDPRDEPADVLLARIAAERAAAPSPKTRGRRAKSV